MSSPRRLKSAIVDGPTIDNLHDKISNTIAKIREKPGMIKMQMLELDLLSFYEEARDYMLAHLSDKTDTERDKLLAIYGGDCVRISRMRTFLRAVEFSQKHASDQRPMLASGACDTVERVLEQRGLGNKIKEIHERRDSFTALRRAALEQVAAQTPRQTKQVAPGAESVAEEPLDSKDLNAIRQLFSAVPQAETATSQASELGQASALPPIPVPLAGACPESVQEQAREPMVDEEHMAFNDRRSVFSAEPQAGAESAPAPERAEESAFAPKPQVDSLLEPVSEQEGEAKVESQFDETQRSFSSVPHTATVAPESQQASAIPTAPTQQVDTGLDRAPEQPSEPKVEADCEGKDKTQILLTKVSEGEAAPDLLPSAEEHAATPMPKSDFAQEPEPAPAPLKQLGRALALAEESAPRPLLEPEPAPEPAPAPSPESLEAVSEYEHTSAGRRSTETCGLCGPSFFCNFSGRGNPEPEDERRTTAAEPATRRFSNVSEEKRLVVITTGVELDPSFDLVSNGTMLMELADMHVKLRTEVQPPLPEDIGKCKRFPEEQEFLIPFPKSIVFDPHNPAAVPGGKVQATSTYQGDGWEVVEIPDYIESAFQQQARSPYGSYKKLEGSTDTELHYEVDIDLKPRVLRGADESSVMIVDIAATFTAYLTGPGSAAFQPDGIPVPAPTRD